MKKRYKVLVLVGVLVMSGWVGWYFAIATPQQSLQIGEVPINQSDDQKALHIVKVGDVTFNMPAYYTEMGGGDGSWAKLRNVYNGECLRKVDGECKTAGGSPPQFIVVLKTPEDFNALHREINRYNQLYLQNCRSPEALSKKYNLPIDHKMVSRGTVCPQAFEYGGLKVEVHFDTGFFPLEKMPAIKKHITAFLNHFRTSSTGE